MPEPHTLQLTRTGSSVNPYAEIFSARCSSCTWRLSGVTRDRARTEHADHLQMKLGPDREGERG